MTITAPSTTQDDDDRARLLASNPDLLHRTNVLLDDQSRRQAKDAAKAQRMRAARTAKLEALVLDAIQAKRARLEREPRCAWTSILLEHFARRGVQAPDEEVVRRVVKSFPGF